MNADFVFRDPRHSDGIYRKHADATRMIELDWLPVLANYWQPGMGYTAGDEVRPEHPTGFAYQASGTGDLESGNRTPRWPTVLAGTVVDGTVTWVAVAPGPAGLSAVASSPSSAVSPSGSLATSGEQIVEDTRVQLVLSGGTEGGGQSVTLDDGSTATCYVVTVTVTAGPEVLVGSLLVAVVAR